MAKFDDLMNAIKLKAAAELDLQNEVAAGKAKIAELEAAAAAAAAAPVVLPADAASPEQVQAALDAVNAIGVAPAPVAPAA